MKLALFGYGKMGKAIEKIAKTNGHEIVLRVTKANILAKVDLTHNPIDVAIEFSTPESAFNNIKKCLEAGITVVSGTTGWLDRLPEIERLTHTRNGTFFYASNFSIGVNLFLKASKQLAKLTSPYSYSVKIEETHHIHKKDAPSGTAITIAENIIEQHPSYNNWTKENGSLSSELPISSTRKGEIPGTHAVIYASNHDVIRIEHQALNRQGFAEGAMAVTEWVHDKKGVLGMEDYLDDI